MNNQKIYDYLKGFLTEEKIEKIEQNVLYKTNYILPVFEDIFQYRNAAAIVRSLEGLGVNRLWALEGRNIFKPEEAVSRGAEKWIFVDRKPHNINTIHQIKQNGYSIVSISPENNAIDLDEVPIDKPLALLFGTEWQGVSETFLQASDFTAKIPMFGFTQSFNVSVAAAISVYTLMQKLRKNSSNFHLTEEEKLLTKIHWATQTIPHGKEIVENWQKSNLIIN